MDKNILVYFYPYLRIIHQAWNWPLAWVFQCRINSLAKKWPYSTSSSNWPYVVISSMQQNNVATQQIQKKLAYLVSTPYWIPPKTKKQLFNSEPKKIGCVFCRKLEIDTTISSNVRESRKCCDIVHFSNSLLDDLKQW